MLLKSSEIGCMYFFLRLYCYCCDWKIIENSENGYQKLLSVRCRTDENTGGKIFEIKCMIHLIMQKLT